MARPDISPEERARRRSRDRVVLAVLGIGMAVVVFGSMQREASDPVASRARLLDILRDELQDACESAVRATLKAPSTAKFVGEKWNIRYDLDADTSTAIFGAVDSQNSFGAMLRNDFACTGYVSPAADTFGLLSLAIAGRVIDLSGKTP